MNLIHKKTAILVLRIYRFSAVKLILVVFLCSFVGASAEEVTKLASDGSDLPQILNGKLNAVVRIFRADKTKRVEAIGTGFHIGNGIVLTAGHMLSKEPFSEWRGESTDNLLFLYFGNNPLFNKNANTYSKGLNARVLKAIFLPTSGIDYAILKLDSNWPIEALELDFNQNAAVGMALYLIGTTDEVQLGILKNSKMKKRDGKSLEHSDSAPHGFSGGPIIDAATGKVMGITSGSWSFGGGYDHLAQMKMQEVKVNVGFDLLNINFRNVIDQYLREYQHCGSSLAQIQKHAAHEGK